MRRANEEQGTDRVAATGVWVRLNETHRRDGHESERTIMSTILGQIGEFARNEKRIRGRVEELATKI